MRGFNLPPKYERSFSVSDSNLFHTTFNGVTMDGAKMKKAYLLAARMNRVQARRADFTDAFMKDLNIENSDRPAAASNARICCAP